MKNYALIKDGRVENIIIVEDEAWLSDHVEKSGYDQAFDISSLNYPISTGFIKKNNRYIPPVVISVEPFQIKPDGVEKATITYTDNQVTPLESIDGDVNGSKFTLSLVNGVGSLDVTSTSPGDLITITFGDQSTSVHVLEA